MTDGEPTNREILSTIKAGNEATNKSLDGLASENRRVADAVNNLVTTLPTLVGSGGANQKSTSWHLLFGIGGLIFGTFLTLVFIPLVYSLVVKEKVPGEAKESRLLGLMKKGKAAFSMDKNKERKI